MKVEITSIKDIYQHLEKLTKLEKIKVSGWVKSVRESKEVVFIILNDGSTNDNLQIVISQTYFLQNELLKKINFGSGLLVSGNIILTPQRKQSCELQATEIIFVNSVAEDYPFQKKDISLETVRNYPHLRAKTNYFLVLFRLRHSISKAVHDFFHQEGFYYVSTPIITGSDAEGAGEFFSIDDNEKDPFFPKKASLTVSGQLQTEALAQGLGKVYTFSPCFRAEKSNTTRHLAEFYMIETEMVCADLATIISLSEKLIKGVIKYILDSNISDLEFLESYHQKQLINKLKNLLNSDFKIIKYAEVIEILEINKQNFVFNDIKWGMDLQSEHEKYLCKHFNSLVFVTNYPINLKAFYMKNNLDKRTVDCFDLLIPEIGELIGGSMREDNYEVLKNKAQKIGIDSDNLGWYLDLRRYGYISSGGFGLGLERLIMFISGTDNIRDTIAFPRYPKHLET
ncbi:MAG: Asparagine--tRNA ligase [Mycoplasmataceae bacterium]|nr:MAG: Asparagine--tRNA ligase [Mycoplasmataceae bacterium]